MWNRRKDEPKGETPGGNSSPFSPSTSEGIPLSTSSMRNLDADYPRGVATIGKSVTVKGQIFSREDLFVDGEVEGMIEAPEHKVTLGLHGKVQANIRAREILVLGTLLGNVEALDKIEIRKEARLTGDIKTARIVIEDGAYFKGSIDIVKPESAKPAPPKPVAQAAVPQTAPAAGGGAR
jgi:cytoskeletal protein CcmA (bactofilin family)